MSTDWGKTKHGVVNAIWYAVADVGQQLHLLSERGERVSLTYDQAAECLTLRHAMTVHKSQSRTLHGHVRLCPGARPGHVHAFWTLTHLLVAASRATSIHNLSIE